MALRNTITRSSSLTSRLMAGGFMSPFVLGNVIQGGGGSWRRFLAAVRAWRDPRCPAGGMFVNGRCVGGLSQVN